MTAHECERQLAQAEHALASAHEELAETNRGVILLSMELEDALAACTTELSEAHLELEKTNRELLQLTLELDDRVAERTAALQKSERQLEQRVRERTAELDQRTTELEAANRELESFSYSVSHDLRAPLRAMDGFSRILIEEYGPQLPKEMKEYLQEIRIGTQQMGHLVDDLLAFSRLGRQPIREEVVAHDDLVRQCLDGLRIEREGRQVDLIVGELRPSRGDPALLKQVWMNLLSNALKYTRKQANARIDVGCEANGSGAITYVVKDNGVGFDMRYAAKLFGVFQRLHRAEDYEGTGVGLAIVQRIVHRHGGRVWAEARPGEGAKFFFTLTPALPKKEDGTPKTRVPSSFCAKPH
jgi:light-regulated signal transduction histidine kinase (bacteriophytochrome)